MAKALLSFILSVSAITGAMAQETVRGVVVDKKNEPIPGVRVELVGSTESVTTDIDGRFSIEVPYNIKKLRFSYVGNKPIERKVSPDMRIKFGGGWISRQSGYRGFFNFVGGFGCGGVVNANAGEGSITNIGKSTFGAGIDTSHGYQINRHFFAGLGVGAQVMMCYRETDDADRVDAGMGLHGPIFQIYGDFRWDYDLTAKTTPYAGIKMGWQYVGIERTYDYFYDYYDPLHLRLNSVAQSGFLLMPSVGMRLAIGSKRGLNIGISYNILLRRKFRVDYDNYLEYPDGSYVDNEGSILLGPTNGGMALLNIGFDF